MDRSVSENEMSDRSEDERFLWELSANIDEKGSAVPSDADLAGYRAGQLDAEAAARVEDALAHSSETRRRLAEISAASVASPSAAARERYLFSLPRKAKRSVRRRWQVSAAAAAMVAMMLGYGWMSLRTPSDLALPADLSFVVTIDDLAEVRSRKSDSSQEPSEWTLMPENPLNLTTEPVGDAVPGLDFGLYLLDGDKITRQLPDAGLHLDVVRGSATFTAERVADLLGSTPGTYSLFLVVAKHGNLPDSRLEAGDDPATALGAGSAERRVSRHDITLLETPEEGP